VKRQCISAAVTCLALLLATACADNSSAEKERSGSKSPTPSDSSPASTPTTVETNPAEADATATAQDVRLMRDFVAFAVEPSAETAAPLPFATEIQLGLSRDLTVTLDKSSVPEASAWVIDSEAFRGYVGPFSALRLVERHAAKAKSQSVSGHRSVFTVSVAEHPNCASPPVPAPKGFGNLRRLSVQPSEGSIDSCLSWFSVDLFLDAKGAIRAVTLDIWEP
jgi:hypothetical protein